MPRHPLFIFLFMLPFLAAAQTQTINYTTSDPDFLSPERGFYRYTETRSSNPTPLTTEGLNTIRAESRTLIFRYIYLDSFLDSPISLGFLQQIEADFATIRTAGFKVILRFAYTDTLPPVPPYNDSPPKALLLQHIAQLKPILRANSDVLLTLQNGFWGVWGENYYSDEFGSVADAPLTAQNWTDRREVTDSLLAVLPEDRLLSVRYPLLKSNFYDFEIPADSLTVAEAYSGSVKSRIGYHNDCFLVAANDFTFENTNTEKPYWETESRYTIMGGESCGDTPEFTNCHNALIDLEYAHWTYLNDYYHPDVLDRWEQEGCLVEIRRRLGYRIFMLAWTFPIQVSPGGELACIITLRNDGFAAPVHDRPLKLILRSADDEFTLDLPVDIRRWYGGGTYNHQLSLELPDNLPSGSYQLYLHLPDAAPSLSTDPRYALRLANTDMWEAATGYHDLQLQVEVRSPNASKELKEQASCFNILSSGDRVYTVQSDSRRYHLRVLDIMGRVLKQFPQLSGDFSFHLAHQPKGLYLLQLYCEEHEAYQVFKF